MKLSAAVLVVLVLTLGLVACKGETKPATNITSTSARLNLTGEADNGPAYSYFEYWQTATPGIKYTTPTRNWPAGAKGDFPETVGRGSGRAPLTASGHAGTMWARELRA